MLRPYAAERVLQSKLVYRGYDLEVRRAPSGWQVGIYPRSDGALKGTLGTAKALYRFATLIRPLTCLQKKIAAPSTPQILQMVQPSRFNREYACPQ